MIFCTPRCLYAACLCKPGSSATAEVNIELYFSLPSSSLAFSLFSPSHFLAACMCRCASMKGLYNNPALIQDRIRLFEGFDFEKSTAANQNTEYLSSLLFLSAGHGDVSKDTSGQDLK